MVVTFSLQQKEDIKDLSDSYVKEVRFVKGRFIYLMSTGQIISSGKFRRDVAEWVYQQHGYETELNKLAFNTLIDILKKIKDENSTDSENSK